MKIVHRKWKTDKVRKKRAKLMVEPAPTLKWEHVNDIMKAEDKAGVQPSKLPFVKMEVQKVGPPVRPTDWHLEAGDGYYAVVPGPRSSDVYQ